VLDSTLAYVVYVYCIVPTTITQSIRYLTLHLVEEEEGGGGSWVFIIADRSNAIARCRRRLMRPLLNSTCVYYTSYHCSEEANTVTTA